MHHGTCTTHVPWGMPGSLPIGFRWWQEKRSRHSRRMRNPQFYWLIRGQFATSLRLFSFMLEKYVVCDACGLRSPSFESSSVLYITPTCTSSMQELIKQGMKQQLETSCFRRKKNTWHVESNYLLQPPKYLIIVVNRFRYINNNFTKDRCSIPMNMAVVFGLHKFSLQATIDHHGPSMYSDHYTASINCCKRTFYYKDSKITEFKLIDT